MRPEDQPRIYQRPVPPPEERRGWVVGKPPVEAPESPRPGFADALAAEQENQQGDSAAEQHRQLFQAQSLHGGLVGPQQAPGDKRALDEVQAAQDAAARARLFAARPRPTD